MVTFQVTLSVGFLYSVSVNYTPFKFNRLSAPARLTNCASKEWVNFRAGVWTVGSEVCWSWGQWASMSGCNCHGCKAGSVSWHAHLDVLCEKVGSPHSSHTVKVTELYAIFLIILILPAPSLCPGKVPFTHICERGDENDAPHLATALTANARTGHT